MSSFAPHMREKSGGSARSGSRRSKDNAPVPAPPTAEAGPSTQRKVRTVPRKSILVVTRLSSDTTKLQRLSNLLRPLAQPARPRPMTRRLSIHYISRIGREHIAPDLNYVTQLPNLHGMIRMKMGMDRMMSLLGGPLHRGG